MKELLCCFYLDKPGGISDDCAFMSENFQAKFLIHKTQTQFHKLIFSRSFFTRCRVPVKKRGMVHMYTYRFIKTLRWEIWRNFFFQSMKKTVTLKINQNQLKNLQLIVRILWVNVSCNQILRSKGVNKWVKKCYEH